MSVKYLKTLKNYYLPFVDGRQEVNKIE